MPLFDDLHQRLTRDIPPQQGAGIVHGDYRLDNTMMGHDGTVAAVLDWELCTLGDVLADVASMAMWWGDDPRATGRLRDVPTKAVGFGSRSEMLERYGQNSDRDISDLFWYVAFQFWRLAAISEGVRVLRHRFDAADRRRNPAHRPALASANPSLGQSCAMQTGGASRERPRRPLGPVGKRLAQRGQRGVVVGLLRDLGNKFGVDDDAGFVDHHHRSGRKARQQTVENSHSVIVQHLRVLEGRTSLHGFNPLSPAETTRRWRKIGGHAEHGRVVEISGSLIEGTNTGGAYTRIDRGEDVEHDSLPGKVRRRNRTKIGSGESE